MTGQLAKLCIWCVLTGFMISCQNKSADHQSLAKNERSSEEQGENASKQVLLFFGNSLTAGYGLDPSQAFPHLIQNKLDSLGWPYQVVNAGLSGDTSTSGKNRIDWVLRDPVDIMVLELGANDGLRGIPPSEMENNLQQIIDLAQQKYPGIKIILAGMESPPNMGQEYVSEFREVFPTLAQRNNLPLIPFLLQGVAGEPEYNLDDGIHPNEKGHQLVAENVWQVLQPELSTRPVTADDN